MKKNFNKNLIILGLISLVFFFGKWAISFIFFYQEDLIIKIINESYQDSSMYFHYVKSFADFNFKENYNTTLVEEKFLAFPIGSILFHSILYKFIGVTSFIVLEFLSIFIFLVIFYLIFKQFKVNDICAIFLSTLIFVLPIITEQINIFNIIEINTFSQNFYNLRFPRPLISQLYFFIFILILIISFRDEMFKLKYILPLSIVMGLTLSSFFFVFFTQFISYLFLLGVKYKQKIFPEIYKNYKNIILGTILFLILIIPFFILLSGTSESYSSRMGIFDISLEKKIFLLAHYFEKLTRVKILLFYLLIFTLYFFHLKFIKQNNDTITVILFIFIASLLSPIIFVIISNKISFLYHFNNLVVISAFLFLIFFSVSLLVHFFSKIIINRKYSFYFGILVILIFYNLHVNLKTINEIKQNKNRYEINEIVSLIKNNSSFEIKNLNLLTFNNKILIWSILNNIKNLKIVDGTFSAKSDELVENDLIESLRFLNLNKNDFEQFVNNQKVGYRYINKNARQLFWQKYQANSLFTFKNSSDFDYQTLKFIKNSSPFHSHQFAIPKFELKRLIKKFENTKEKKFYFPDIIVIENDREVIKNSKVNSKLYCMNFDGKYYKMYILKKYCN